MYKLAAATALVLLLVGPVAPARAKVTLVLRVMPRPAMTIAGSARPSVAQVGDPIAYAYVVTNTGNVPLHDVRVDADHAAVRCPRVVLRPQRSITCASSPYLTTRADLARPRIDARARATATPPFGGRLTTSSSLTPVLTTATRQGRTR